MREKEGRKEQGKMGKRQQKRKAMEGQERGHWSALVIQVSYGILNHAEYGMMISRINKIQSHTRTKVSTSLSKYQHQLRHYQVGRPVPYTSGSYLLPGGQIKGKEKRDESAINPGLLTQDTYALASMPITVQSVIAM